MVKITIACAVMSGALWAQSQYAAWAKPDSSGAWTAITESAVRASGLLVSEPTDAARFCPGYAGLNEAERAQFWVGLLSAVAQHESSFRPAAMFTEAFKDRSQQKVVSRGLLQLSMESANQTRYGCGIGRAEELHEPAINLACGVKILDAWVRADKTIVGAEGGPHLGGGRYWSTLRRSSKSLPRIQAFTNGMAVCQGTILFVRLRGRVEWWRRRELKP